MTALRTLTLIIITIITLSAVPVPARAEGLPTCYMAEVKRVIDGDTLRVSVPVWPDVYIKTAVRIADINAPEKDDAARAYLKKIAGARVSVCHVRHGKYAGRVVADVFTQGGENIAEALVEAGYAKRVGR